jgi:hypothetical protein
MQKMKIVISTKRGHQRAINAWVQKVGDNLYVAGYCGHIYYWDGYNYHFSFSGGEGLPLFYF